jgi:hypothetical protein
MNVAVTLKTLQGKCNAVGKTSESEMGVMQQSVKAY